jgi:hypothetical protein
MGLAKFLKAAFVFSVLLYGGVALFVAGPPDWTRPAAPEAPMAPLFYALTLCALGLWAAGVILGRREQAPSLFRSGPRPWPLQRFILAAALVEGGALLGLVLSLVLKDSRYGLAHAVVAAILLILLPASEE